MKSDLEKTFAEVNRDIRMWPKWQLQSRDAHTVAVWDRMSKHDREFNEAWNRLRAICHDTTLPKLRKMLDAARLIESGGRIISLAPSDFTAT
jgi:hypothetical protein